MAKRPAWTISRAADECAVSRDTIKRHRTRGDFPNATQNERGHWTIPVDDLLAAGLHPGKPRTTPDTPGAGGASTRGKHQVHDEPAPGARPSATEQELAELRTQNELLQVRLDTEQRLRTAIEQSASDLRTALRMLEATPRTTPLPIRTRKQHWWSR